MGFYLVSTILIYIPHPDEILGADASYTVLLVS